MQLADLPNEILLIILYNCKGYYTSVSLVCDHWYQLLKQTIKKSDYDFMSISNALNTMQKPIKLFNRRVGSTDNLINQIQYHNQIMSITPNHKFDINLNWINSDVDIQTFDNIYNFMFETIYNFLPRHDTYDDTKRIIRTGGWLVQVKQTYINQLSDAYNITFRTIGFNTYIYTIDNHINLQDSRVLMKWKYSDIPKINEYHLMTVTTTYLIFGNDAGNIIILWSCDNETYYKKYNVDIMYCTVKEANHVISITSQNVIIFIQPLLDFYWVFNMNNGIIKSMFRKSIGRGFNARSITSHVLQYSFQVVQYNFYTYKTYIIIASTNLIIKNMVNNDYVTYDICFDDINVLVSNNFMIVYDAKKFIFLDLISTKNRICDVPMMRDTDEKYLFVTSESLLINKYHVFKSIIFTQRSIQHIYAIKHCSM